MRSLRAAAMVMVLAAASPATSEAQGTGGIKGRVVQLDTGQPLRRAGAT